MLALELQAVAVRIQQLCDAHWCAFDPICAAVDDKVWVGPAGRRFGAAVRADRSELRTQLSKAVQSAQAKLVELRKLS